MKYTLYFGALCCLSLTLLVGCDLVERPRDQKPSAALQKFLKVGREELLQDKAPYPLQAKQIGKTLWIYLPLEDSLFEMSSDPFGPQKSKQAEEKINLAFIDADMRNGDFFIEYDTQKTRQYKISNGYRPDYGESYQKFQRDIMGTLKEVFLDADNQKDDPLPDFIVMVFADVKRGIEIENIFAYTDFKKTMSVSGELPLDEWMKRVVSDIRGDSGIISDINGRHLPWNELTWPEFLGKQIKNRVNFKYQRSDFPPSENASQEIGRVVKETIAAYDFKNYVEIRLKNLATGQEFTVK
ncbi:MAG: hypothetical protein HQL23_08215 [Candidatus Omnitrophica bacterium]|nr:hypothetical protein [Candidatus Omnitrophota bacterium]